MRLTLALLLLCCLETAAQAAEVEPGRALFQSKCVVCHQLPEPGMLQAKQWRMVLVTMQQRMQQANIPVLTQQEQDLIIRYLSASAKE